jgi:hypothetical protein
MKQLIILKTMNENPRSYIYAALTDLSIVTVPLN